VRSAASIVLGGELFVVLFAALVARGLSDASDRAVLMVSLVMVVLIFAAMATMRRPPVGFVLGSVVQAALLASTVWIHLMAVVGLIFTGLWVLALVQGHKVDEIRAARLRE
jgi:Mn2+/Fe2+ NRAMP family transporter